MKLWNTVIYICVFTIIYLSGFISCLKNRNPSEQHFKNKILSQDKLGYLEMDGDSVLIPEFEIEVSLSPNAEKKLKENNETVIVSAMFSGVPKDTTSEEFQIWGTVNICEHSIELNDKRIAGFEKVRFHSSILNKLSDIDIFLLINVFSGRRSSDNNILDVEFLQDKMSVVKGQKYILKGKLIGEDD